MNPHQLPAVHVELANGQILLNPNLIFLIDWLTKSREPGESCAACVGAALTIAERYKLTDGVNALRNRDLAINARNLGLLALQVDNLLLDEPAKEVEGQRQKWMMQITFSAVHWIVVRLIEVRTAHLREGSELLNPAGIYSPYVYGYELTEVVNVPEFGFSPDVYPAVVAGVIIEWIRNFQIPLYEYPELESQTKRLLNMRGMAELDPNRNYSEFVK